MGYFKKEFPAWEVLPNETGQVYDHRPKWMQDFGLYWIGFPGQREVLNYKFSWNEFTKDADGKSCVLTRAKTTNFFYVSAFPYVMVEAKAKTSEGIEVDIIYILSLQITNPYVALFDNVDWLTQVEGAVGKVVRNFIGSFKYMQLISETDETDQMKKAAEDFSAAVMAIVEELRLKYGVTIKAADLQNILPTGALAKQNEEMITLKFRTAAEAEALTMRTAAQVNQIRETALAEAAAHLAKAEAEAKGNAAKYKAIADSPDAAEMEMRYDALKGSQNINLNGGFDVLERIADRITGKGKD